MLPHTLHFDPSRDAELFAAVPPAPAVFLLRGAEGEPYVSKTASLRRRLTRLLSPPAEHSRRLNLRERVRTVEYALTGSDFESGLLLYQVLRREFPKTYARRLRLRPAPLVRLILENEYPRATVTTRIATLRGRSLYYGPFPTRAAAEKFANDSLDFFKMRRCTDDLHPDPAFPGCIYSEMKMCLAPCFKGCTDAEYRAEVERVQAYFDSRGQSLVREITAQRDQASAALEFENAAAIHTRLEKVVPVVAQAPEIVRRLDHLGGLVIQPSAEPDCVALFRIEAGRLHGPIQFSVQAKTVQQPDSCGGRSSTRPDPCGGDPCGGEPCGGGSSTRPDPLGTAPPPRPRRAESPSPHTRGSALSMEARILEILAAVPPLPPAAALETMEHLAYLKRWYYRTSMSGEVFFTDEKGELPLRRIVRGVSRVFRGEKPAGDLSETARDYWVNRGKAAQLNPEDYNI